MKKNQSNQKWRVYAFHRLTGVPYLSGASSITAKIRKDYGSGIAITDTNPTEIEDGNYEFDLTQAETNGDVLDILPESSTTGIGVVGFPNREWTESVSGENLSGVPWNSTWDAEVQSECTDALNAYDGPTNTEMEARTLTSGNYATSTGQTNILNRIGTSGEALSGIPWHSTWDSEVQSEVQDAIEANNLDHFIKVAKDTNWSTTVTKESLLDLMTSKDSSQTFDRSTDSQEATRDALTVVSAGVAATIQANTNTETTGSLISGTYAQTYLSNGTYWITAPVSPAVGGYGLNVHLTFSATTGQYINSVTIRGYFSAGPGRYINIGAWNYVSSQIDILSDSTSRMNNASANGTYTYTLLSAHQKADGEVKIYFLSPSTTTGDRLNIDQCLVNVNSAGATAADIAEAVKQKMIVMYYSNGVWYDNIYGTSGTIVGTNGTSTNSSNNYTDLMTIANILGVKRVYLKPASSIILAQNHDDWRFIGAGSIELAGQSIENTVFEDIYEVTGTGVGDDIEFTRCGIGNTTLEHCYMRGCFIKGIINLVESQDYHLLSCADAIDVGTSTLIFASGTNVYMRDWRGGIQLNNMEDGSECVIDGAGRVIIDESCTGGDLIIRGHFAEPSGIDAFIAAGGTVTQSARFATDNDTDGTNTLLTRISQTIPFLNDGGTYYPKVDVEKWSTSGVPTEFEASNLPAKYPATLSSSDVSGNLPTEVMVVNSGAIEDIFSNTPIVEDYPATGVSATPAQILYLIMQSLHEFGISGVKRTVRKLDGQTTAVEFTLNSDTTPTDTTRSA